MKHLWNIPDSRRKWTNDFSTNETSADCLIFEICMLVSLIKIYWVAHDAKFVYFGGQEVKQVRPKGISTRTYLNTKSIISVEVMYSK